MASRASLIEENKMARTRIDWQHHMTAFTASGLKVGEYCEAAGLNLGTFRSHIYESRRRARDSFKEFSVASELTISRDDRGELSIRGFDVAQLSAVVGAWSDALSQ